MNRNLGSQFTSKKVVGSKTAKVFKKNPPKTVADAVYDQLTEDYPKDALNWVHSIDWQGPLEVPVKQLDFSQKDSWAASHEPDNIKKWKSRIKAAEKRGEHIKPGLLIRRPDKKYKNTPYMIPDGHHRALAYEEEGEPMYAWVGLPDKSSGPWDKLHDKQYRDNTGPQKGGNPGSYHYGKEPR